MKNSPKGFTLIELLIVVVILGIIAAIAIPNLMGARRNANESSAVASMRSISSAQTTYRSTVGSGNFGEMTSLISGGLLDPSFSSGIRSGYVFTIVKTDQSAGQPPVFDASSIPVKHGASIGGTGTRSYYVNESGLIMFNFTAAAPTSTSTLDRTINNGEPVR